MRTNEQGRTMLEMMCVLGIIAIISLAAINGYQYMLARYHANKTLETFTQLMGDIQQNYATQEDFYGLNNETIISMGIVPSVIIKNGSQLNNPYGGGFFNVFYSNRNDNNASDGGMVVNDVTAAVIEVGNISRKTCTALAQADWNQGSTANISSGLIAAIASPTTAVSGGAGSIYGGSDLSRSVLTNAGSKVDVIYDEEDRDAKYTSSAYSKLGVGVFGNTQGYGIPMRPDIVAKGCNCVNDEGVDSFNCSFALKMYILY